MAARELGTVSLADALALTLLLAETVDDRWPRAAAQWLGRFIVDSPAMTIGEAGLAAAAIQELAAGNADWLATAAATRGYARPRDGNGGPRFAVLGVEDRAHPGVRECVVCRGGTRWAGAG